jgi:hypothetical protein
MTKQYSQSASNSSAMYTHSSHTVHDPPKGSNITWESESPVLNGDRDADQPGTAGSTVKARLKASPYAPQLPLLSQAQGGGGGSGGGSGSVSNMKKAGGASKKKAGIGKKKKI